MNLIAAEWIKIRSLRSTYGLLVLGLGFAAAAAWWLGSRVHIAPGAASSFNPLIYPYNDTTWGFLTVLAATFGALVIAGEYSTGLIRTTFIAVPARHQVVLAKALVASAVMAVFGVTASLVSLYVAGAALSGQLSGLSLDQPVVLRAAALSALLPVLGVLVGMAIGALLRHPAAAIGAVWGVLLLLPAVLGSGTIDLGSVTQAMPLAAWAAIAHTSTPGPHPTSLPGTGVAWALIAVWPLLSLATATVAITRRDT